MDRRHIADYAEHLFARLAGWLVDKRGLVACLLLLTMIVSIIGISKVRVDSSIANIFTPSDPSYVAYKEYLDDFNSDEVCYILYRVKGGRGLFDIDIMRKVVELSNVLESEVPFVDEVVSLANVEFMQAVGENDIQIDDLLYEFPENQTQLSKLEPIVMAKQNFKNLVISEDGEYAAIIVKMAASRLNDLDELKLDPDGGTLSSNLYPSVSYNKVNQILNRPEYRALEFYLTGDVSINSERNRILTINNALVAMASLGVVLLLSIFFFNATAVGVIAPLLVVVMSLFVTVGLMGFQGWSVGIFFGLIPTLLCAIGVAQSVHILVDYQRSFVDTHDPNESIENAIRKVGGPCLLAALTTAISFMVMVVSDMQSMRELAIYAAVGIVSTFVISISLLAVCLSRKSTSKVKLDNLYTSFSVHKSVTSWIESCINTNLRTPMLVFIISTIVIGGSMIGLKDLQFQVELIEDFKPDVKIRQHTEFVEANMNGNASLVYLIDTQTPDGVKEPSFIRALEEVQEFTHTLPLVRDSRSINNILKELNQSFHADQEQYFTIPTSKELLAQYLLVYEFSGGEQLTDFVSIDYSRTALKLRLAMASSQEIEQVVNQIDEFIAQSPIAQNSVKVTGMGMLWVKIGEYIMKTQIIGYLLVFLMIGVLVSVVYGSIKIGLISMIPNLAPIFITMGLMGWANVPLDHFKIMIGTIALGIAVDDTIHLITRYRSWFLVTGSYDRAMTRCLRDVGPALVITSLILVGAFSTFVVSEMQTLASFGSLLAGAIILALVSDLYLLPCMIKSLKLFGAEFDSDHVDVEDLFHKMDQSRAQRMMVTG